MKKNFKVKIYLFIYLLASIYNFIIDNQFNAFELRGLFVISILHIFLVVSWNKNFLDNKNEYYFFLFFYFLFVYIISSMALLLVITQANILLAVMNIFLFVLSSMKVISYSWRFEKFFGL